MTREFQVIYRLEGGALGTVTVHEVTDAAAVARVEAAGKQVARDGNGKALVNEVRRFDWSADVFDTQEAAEFMRCSVRTVARCVERGWLSQGGLYRRRELEACIAKLREERGSKAADIKLRSAA